MQKLICSVYIKRLLLIVILIPLNHYIFSQENSPAENSGFEYYRQINEKEPRLAEFRDNDEALKIKLIQLDIINRSRKKFRAAPVKLDILASRVANKMCREAAENKYLSHWNLAGEKPYHRYAFAGGYDHVSENAYGEWGSETYEISSSLIGKMMEKGHTTFMSERAPNDGHKKNIIEKAHNFVGIGYYMTDGQFRYYEEFVDRYLEFENIPAELKKNEPSAITVRTNGSGFLYFLIIYREKFTQPQKVSQLSRTGSYDDYTNDEYLQIPAWDLARYRDGSTYRIPLKFTKEGLYYIHIFLDKKENTGSSSLNTKGKTSASGIVIRVGK
jgi:uncharacterized protein YkwD